MTPTSTNLSGFRSAAFIGLGSNVGDPIQQIQHAFREIDEITETSLIKVSSLYESAPIGFCDQPAFINAVVEIATTLSPQQLMQNLLRIESDHGRTREQKNGPRTLDLDVLLFNNWIIDAPTITTPHPRAHERAFVLLPLLEIAPEVYIPGIGYARDFLSAVVGQMIRRLDDEAVNVNL
jgi:2-amino-4-hydroxy-6-hydroxymethyldihydropteridine diphosphokinase